MSKFDCCHLFSWLPQVLPLNELWFFTEVAEISHLFSTKSFNIISYAEIEAYIKFSVYELIFHMQHFKHI